MFYEPPDILPPDDFPKPSIKVQTIANDGTVVVFDESECSQSTLLADLVSSFASREIEGIPVPTSGKILKLMRKFARMHKGEQLPKNLLPKDTQVPELDQQFLKTHRKSLMDILEASDYMGITRLYSYACKKVAAVMKGKTTEELSKIFKLPDIPEVPMKNNKAAQKKKIVKKDRKRNGTRMSKLQYWNPFIFIGFIIGFIMSWFHEMVAKGFWLITILGNFPFFNQISNLRMFQNNMLSLLNNEVVFDCRALSLNHLADILHYAEQKEIGKLALVDKRWRKMITNSGRSLPFFVEDYITREFSSFEKLFDELLLLKQSNPEKFKENLFFVITIVIVDKVWKRDDYEGHTEMVQLGCRKVIFVNDSDDFRIFSHTPMEDLIMLCKHFQSFLSPEYMAVEFNGSDENPSFVAQFIKLVDWMNSGDMKFSLIRMNIEFACSQWLDHRIESITRERSLSGYQLAINTCQLMMTLSEPVDLKWIMMSVEKLCKTSLIHRNGILCYFTANDGRNARLWNYSNNYIKLESLSSFWIERELNSQKAGEISVAPRMF